MVLFKDNFNRGRAEGWTDERTIFVGTYSGLYKSRDGGKTWKHLDEGFNRHDVMDLVFHPQNPNMVSVREPP